ncbi:MAG: DsrE family protein [Anaerolineales bacterium]|nr:DsrE family protein [Anaerolineales bacterium]
MKPTFNKLTRVATAVLAVYGAVTLAVQVFSVQPALAGSLLAGTATPTAAAAATKTPVPPTPRPAKDLANGLFVSLTTDDLNTAAMAIGFATKIVTGTDKPVTIFLNVDGVRLVDVNIPQNTHSSGKTMHQMLQMFMDEGGVVLVCPTCMVNVGGMVKTDVLPGVIIGTPEYTWTAMFAEGVTVLSY